MKYLKDMSDVLQYRGPDDSGYYFTEIAGVQVGLGQRRLSILDLSENGHQPMIFQDLILIFNGEIYNFKEIRQNLELLGYRFDSNSDTEVILKAFHRWGPNMVHKLNGMFVIVIFNKVDNILTILRDRAGIKPLFYYFKNGLFLFASELKSFHKHPEFKKSINFEALSLFLQYGYIPQPHTIFSDTYKLKAGHVLTINLRNKELEEVKYWDVIDYYNKPKINISEEDVLQETERLLISACEYRMVSDVPVGIFLSGGYDSSVVTALLQSSRTKNLKTFTIGFHEQAYNEAHHAKKVSDHLGTEHTELYCTQKDALRILPLLPFIYDEPFGDSSAIPTILVSELARKQVTVSLSADGGDEVFGGYHKYVQARKYHELFARIPFRNKAGRLLKSFAPEALHLDGLIKNFSSLYKNAASILDSNSATHAMRNFQQIFTEENLPGLLLTNQQTSTTNFDFEHLLNANLSDLDKMMAIDFSTYQLDDILTKVDRATMSVSLEGREPLLDYRLIEFVSQLNPDYKIKGNIKKYLLKEITHKYIPEKIMNRPKMGFSIPLLDWLGNELSEYMEYYLDESKLIEQGIFNVQSVMLLKKRYLKGNTQLIDKLWLILVFQMWYEKWMKN